MSSPSAYPKKPPVRGIVFVLVGFVVPWVIVYGPLMFSVGPPGWDGSGGQYYIASLLVAGMLARLYARTRGGPLLTGLLLGTVSLLVMRSAPVSAALVDLGIVLGAATVGWWIGGRGRRIFTRVPAP